MIKRVKRRIQNLHARVVEPSNCPLTYVKARVLGLFILNKKGALCSIMSQRNSLVLTQSLFFILCLYFRPFLVSAAEHLNCIRVAVDSCLAGL
jgi:hypothetical protein